LAEIQEVEALLVQQPCAFGEKSGCADDSIFVRLKTVGGRANVGFVHANFSFRVGILPGAPILSSSTL
jgi:hypothetical protein